MSTQKALDVQGILKRAKWCLGIETDVELADLMGVKQNTVSAWKRRGNPDLLGLVKLCPGVSMDWLICGRGEPNWKEKTGVVEKIVSLVEEMEEDQQREILKHVQKEELLTELLKRQAGGAR